MECAVVYPFLNGPERRVNKNLHTLWAHSADQELLVGQANLR